MADNEVGVKITADIKSFLQGMKDAQEHTEKAVSGMKGNLGDLIESFEHMGGAALAVGAAGLAFEVLKESTKFIEESIKETNELARSFEGLSFQLGVSYEELNKLNAAQLTTGGSAQELAGWMKSASRSIGQNADYLVAQGIAANKAELMGMPFVDYLRKVMTAAESIEKPLERAAFLKVAVGRAGLDSAPQIRRFLEQVESAPEILAKFGRAIGEENVAQMAKAEDATGKVSLANKGLMQSIAETFGPTLTKAKEEWAEWVVELNSFATGNISSDIQREIDKLKAESESLNKKLHGAHGASGGHGGGEPGSSSAAGGKPVESKADYDKRIEAEKKAAEDRIAIRKMADDEIIRSAAHVTSEQLKDDKELVASGQMTFAELVVDMKQAYKTQLDTSMKALVDEKAALRGNSRV